MINLIVPMAGRGSRFSKKGYILPKPLVELKNKPFFWWAIESVKRSIEIKQLVCVVLKEHVVQHNIINRVKFYYPEVEFVILDSVTDGALDTALCGLDIINNSLPVLVNDCDQAFEINGLNEYINNLLPNGEISAYLCHFNSDSPSYSYALYDKGYLIQTAEKRIISNLAISGAYVFADKNIIIQNHDKYKLECDYEELFISGIYNVLIEQGKKVKGIQLNSHLSFGTPDELDKVEKDFPYYSWL
ncbi:hypothetical protein [Yersinia sp. 2466 StPb PI]|uniref:hypothetical protein n=1 Tax=Yersinia sp. 2466 StPb PI TaxID=3061648 RepID=UPI00355ADE7E